MASVFAIRAGLRDASLGKPAYFWSLSSDPAHRVEILKDGWKDVGKIFVLALVLDVVYQVMATRSVYPGEALIVAVVLALVPYVLLRGAATRFRSRQ